MTAEFKARTNRRVKQRMIHPRPKEARSVGTIVHALSVKEMMQKKLKTIKLDERDADADNAFYVCDLGDVYRQHMRWKSLLPRIEPFYAIKCNVDPMVTKLLASLGAGFDCASKTEVQQVLDMGVDASRIIYANPCKQASYVRYAAENMIRKMTFDNSPELYKIKTLFPDAELVLRILTDNLKAGSRLGLKFGASMDMVPKLLLLAKDLGLNVIGVSFHVGSDCKDESVYNDAVALARQAFDVAKDIGYEFSLLDVGGGFPSAYDYSGIPTFEKMAGVLGPAVDAAFPSHIRVIAEPGRYYVGSAFTACTQVISVREPDEKQKPMYYLNDGVYSTFNCVINGPRELYPKVLMKNNVLFGSNDEEEHECSLWGPTCDSLDCIFESTTLPRLDIGDWLYWEDMGAYTSSTASRFNGFKSLDVVYTNTNQEDK